MFVARVAFGCYGKGAVLNISLPIIMSLDIILANKMRLVFAAGLWFFIYLRCIATIIMVSKSCLIRQ